MKTHQEIAASLMYDALKAMMACLNNRILGSGANPSDDWKFRQTCIEVCEQARAALARADGYFNGSSMPESKANLQLLAAIIRALETAKMGYAPEHNDFYFGIMHGMQHAIDIVRQAAHPLGTES